MTAKPRSQITSEIASDLPDNTSHLITAADVRQVTGDINDSCLNPLSDSGPPGTVFTSTGSSSRFSVLNIEAPPFGFLWPAYIYPSGGGLAYYATFISLMETYPNVPVIVIQEPSPTGGVNSDYTSSINNLLAAGAEVICYQDTDYGAVPSGTVETNVANLLSYYPNINGIFLDRRDQTTGTDAYYAGLQAYINGLGLKVVMGSPPNGQPYTPGDVFVVWENTAGGYPTIAQLSDNGYGVRAQSAVLLANDAYNADQFLTMTQYCGWVWLSDAPADAAYESLPSYMVTLFEVLSGLTADSQIQGILGPINGGTGLEEIPVNGLMVGDGIQPVKTILPGAAANVPTSTGLEWSSAPPLNIGTYQPVGFLIPAYVYPSPTTYYTDILTAGAANPNINIIFALTPAYTGGADPNYTSIISTIQAAGYKVVLVVDVVDGTLAIGTAEARCATLQGYYPTIDGIIAVGMPTSLGANVTYMQTLYTYVKTTLGMTLLVGDPGSNTPSAYFNSGCADIILATSVDSQWPSASQLNNGGVGGKAQLAALVTTETYDASEFSLMTQYCGWVWTTDQALPAPPTALSTMFAAVQALNLNPSLVMPALTIAGNPLGIPGPMVPIKGISVDNFGHIISNKIGTTAIAAGTGAGTSPTLVSVTGTDMAGIINITTGSGTPATNATIATVTFGNDYPNAPKAVILTPANAVTAALTAGRPFPASLTDASWILKSNAMGLATATAYSWFYMVMG